MKNKNLGGNRGTSSLREKRDDYKREKSQVENGEGDQWMQRQAEKVESIQRE
jgi:hypothetical protein